MRYKNGGKNALVKVKNRKINEDEMLKYTIEYPNGEQEKIPREYMICPYTPNISFFPIQIQELKEAVCQL